MHIILAEISDQAAATLSAALIGAVITGSVAMVVFSLGQYLMWRLETTKHLRQKLEDLLAAILTIQTILARVPKAEEIDHLVFARQVSDLSSAKVQSEAIQHVYFPEAVIHMTELGESVDNLCVELLRFGESKAQAIAEGKTFKIDPANNGVALNTRIVLQKGEQLLNYLSEDQEHLTRLPRFLCQRMHSNSACKCAS